ncbi:hypothetical protein SASPL_116823 [Salvia splendens]|uniref:Uncharacterized protein n=1 Tax=Salvia splendens TaxID=180675 RepID=A0A8X8ZYB9_SALSN|nr:hypothetical protein SASPL_116823 [Salvia splendens]
MQLASKKFEYSRSASELVQADVYLRSGDGNCLFDVTFSNGVLTVPKLTANKWTETFFRNHIAFEHLGYYGYFSKNITSYVMLMDRFIKHKQHLFNNLHKEVLTEVKDFYFAHLCDSLDVHCKSKWRARWFRFTNLSNHERFWDA